jgi:hypothetical protein
MCNELAGWLVFALSWTWLSIAVQEPGDKIRIDNNIGNDNAIVLMDGRRQAGCVIDEVIRLTDVVNIDNVLSKGDCFSELVIFSDGNAMAHVSEPSWTDDPGDEVTVRMQDMVEVPVTIWVMRRPFEETRDRALTDLSRANELFDTMNVGIRFRENAIHDKTSDATPELLDATCDHVDTGTLTQHIRPDAGAVNVVYLNSPGGYRGLRCGTIALIGSGADNESLSHEFGHLLSLKDNPGMGTGNLMCPGVTNRDTITIGQAFRCNMNGDSIINMQGWRNGPTTQCYELDSSAGCPEVAKDVTPR